MILRIWDEWKFCYHLVIRLKSYVSLNAIFKLFFMEFQKTLAIANVNDVDSTRVALLLKFIVFEVPYVVFQMFRKWLMFWPFLGTNTKKRLSLMHPSHFGHKTFLLIHPQMAKGWSTLWSPLFGPFRVL